MTKIDALLKGLIKWFPGILLVIGVVWRFIWLDTIPFSFYHDELDYAVTGQAVAEFGTDISGNWSPFSFTPLTTLNKTAELPAAFHAFFYLFMYDSLLWSRVTTSLFGIGSIFVLGVLVATVTKNKHTGLWAAAFLAINPWHIYISRSSFEGGISLFFQLIFLLSLVRLISFLNKNHKNFSSTQALGKAQNVFTSQNWQKSSLWLGILALSFFGAFFTYHAAKFTMLVFLAIGIVAALFSNVTFQRKAVLVTSLGLIGFVATAWMFYLQVGGQLGSRSSELIFTNDATTNQVNEMRRLTLQLNGLPSNLSSLAHNKATLVMQDAVKQYFAVFDVYRLFITGYEGGFQFSLIVHGYFMLSGLLLIPLGAVSIWKNQANSNPKLIAMLATILLFSPIASAITISTQSIFRSATTYALLVALGGIGAWFVLSSLSKSPFVSQFAKIIGAIILCCFLIFETMQFGYAYLSQYPLRAVDNHDFQYRLLSEYLQKSKQVSLNNVEAAGQVTNEATIIVREHPWSVARAHVGYSGLVSELSTQERQQFSEPQTNTVQVQETTFTSGCPDFSSSDLLVVHAATLEECAFDEYIATQSAELVARGEAYFNVDKTTLTVPLFGLSSPLDSRTYYWALSDSLCRQYESQPFIHTQTLRDFQLHKLTAQEFCETWMKVELYQIVLGET